MQNRFIIMNSIFKLVFKSPFHLLFICTFIATIWGCTNMDDHNSEKLFQRISAERSGIDFANLLSENDSINYFDYLYIYMGGGVAVGDLNNDGLQDVYFTGNMVKNKLYLNKGAMKFEDITEVANVEGDDRWVTGVTLGDANSDGWLDIYVSVSGKWTTKKNLLYINDARPGEIPTFTESAEKYGVADDGNSTQAVFFDYDLDGDLDLYVVNYPLTSSGQTLLNYINYAENTPYEMSDRLYRNDGMQNFVDVTQQAGLAKYGLSLGVSVGDYNQDSWPDVYVSNDFSTPDYLLINNQDGTFSDQIRNSTNHTSYFGMGSDAADINNDGQLDIFQVDMLPRDNRRAKENMDSMNPERFKTILENNMHYQYSANALQLNMGVDSLGLPHFGDIARMAGVSSTDWSWAVLLADLDNDGHKDGYVTNGVRRDINNRDFFKSKEVKNYSDSMTLQLTMKMPSEKIENNAFKNNGDLTFSNVSKDWGLNYKGFSNGMAYGDLDNDGDLDLVVNNLDDQGIIYENKSSDRASTNYLRFKLDGPRLNPFGIGTKIWLKNKGKTQYQELSLTRGFQSSVEPLVHFGVGQSASIEEVKIVWPDRKEQILTRVATNKVVDVAYAQAVPSGDPEGEGVKPLFEDITRQVNLVHRHEENYFDDYRYQLLLPHKTSQYGPALAVADIDRDGLDDFYIGGAKGLSGKMYRQNTDGTFQEISSDVWSADAEQEDVNAVFFDANNDRLPDLYIVSGGNEAPGGSPYYQDRLYVNMGAGIFKKQSSALPEMHISGACAKPFDYDRDGDLDLFIGGRLKPRNYPMPASSFILRNDSDEQTVKFVDVSGEIAPELKQLGMVTAAEWVDADEDGDVDLMIVGEWLPITLFENINGKFVKDNKNGALKNTEGWWFSLKGNDFDGDGDQDFVVGNLGLNYKYQASTLAPFSVYSYDYDNNRKNDLVLGYYQDGVQYPVRGRECSSQQVPAIKVKFKDYSSFAKASLEDIYSTEHLEKSLHYKVSDFSSCYMQNLGKGNFSMHPLDKLAQLSSINAIVAEDFNRDGNIDILMGGNLYGAEVETPRGDASYGAVALGDGRGGFDHLMPYESGLMVNGEIKAMEQIKLANNKQGVLIAKNGDYIQLLRVNK